MTTAVRSQSEGGGGDGDEESDAATTDDDDNSLRFAVRRGGAGSALEREARAPCRAASRRTVRGIAKESREREAKREKRRK